MKRTWLTILLAVTLAGLAGYLYFVELPGEKAKVKKETEENKLLSFERQDITGLTVRSSGEDIVMTPDQSGTWKISAPLQTEADSREVESLLRALAIGKIARTLEEPGPSLEPFGLEKPSITVTITAGTRKETIAVGDIGPISSTLYVLRESDKKVLLTDLPAKDFLNKRLFTFRKKEVLSIDSQQAERLRLTYPKTDIVLYRSDQMDKTKRNKWQIRSPIEAPADSTEVRMILTKMESLKALGFVDAGSERDAVSKKLKDPAALKITAYVGGAERTVKFYQPDPSSGEAYAVTTPEAPIYRVSPGVIKDLTKELFAFQDKRLMGADSEDIAMLAVKTRGEQYTLINQSGTWVLEAKPDEKLDQQKAELFVSRVAGLPAELLIVKQGGPLAPYGLNSPTAEFTATGKDGKVKGRVALGTKTGGLVYAMGNGIPGIYQVRADILSQIPSPTELVTKSTSSGLPPPS